MSYLLSKQIMRSQLTQNKCIQHFCAQVGHTFCAKFCWFEESVCKNYNNCFT